MLVKWIPLPAEVRRRGYAVDSGAYMSGVTVVAAPFLNSAGRMTRSLVAIGITERMAGQGIDRLAGAMIAARDALDALAVGGQG